MQNLIELVSAYLLQINKKNRSTKDDCVVITNRRYHRTNDRGVQRVDDVRGRFSSRQH